MTKSTDLEMTLTIRNVNEEEREKIAHEVAEGVCRVTGSAPSGMAHTLVPSFDPGETP